MTLTGVILSLGSTSAFADDHDDNQKKNPRAQMMMEKRDELKQNMDERKQYMKEKRMEMKEARNQWKQK